MSAADERSPEETILHTAGKLRAICNRGLRYARNPYEVENLEQMLELSATLTALVDGRPLPEIRRGFLEERHYLTPYAVVDSAVFDGGGRILLIQRGDNGRWALPGGWCEVGELPGEGAVREVWEETGCRVELTALLGIFDNNYHGGQGPGPSLLPAVRRTVRRGDRRRHPGDARRRLVLRRKRCLGMRCTRRIRRVSASRFDGWTTQR